jgi:hypothetical protein
MPCSKIPYATEQGIFGSRNREFLAKNREFSRLSSNGDGRDNQSGRLLGRMKFSEATTYAPHAV